MNKVPFDQGVKVVIATLREIRKDPEKKKKFKAVFLKLHRLIIGVYGTDPDFIDGPE